MPSSKDKLSSAIQRGAVLSEPVKSPNAIDRFLERREVQKYDKTMKKAVETLFSDEAPPASVQRRDAKRDLKGKERQPGRERW